MATPVLTRLSESAMRTISIPDDVESLVDVGAELGGEQADAIWERVIELYRCGVHPGIQLCIRREGDVVLNRAIGHARGVYPGQPGDQRAVRMRTSTPVNLFSAAKAITSIVMHKLEGDGTLVLDDPVAAYVPGFERHGKGAITLHQVLNHTAGIPVIPPEVLDLDLLGDPEAIEEFVLDLRPRSRSGRPAYHTISGGFVMEVVVRRVTGMSLRDVLARDFKRPLGLQWFDYGVKPRDAARVAHNVLTGVRLSPVLSRFFQRLLGMRWEQAVELSNDPRFLTGVIPSANLIGTAADTAAVYQCMLNGGSLDGVGILHPSTVARLIHAPHVRLALDRMIGLPVRYGNGFMMGNTSLSFYGWNHPHAFGHVGMSNSFTWADPDRDLVVALLTTGKPILGPHLAALPRLMAAIHEAFPARSHGVRHRRH